MLREPREDGLEPMVISERRIQRYNRNAEHSGIPLIVRFLDRIESTVDIAERDELHVQANAIGFADR